MALSLRLMGRVWPPSEADLKEAYQVCDELGRGNLLTRMPSGLMQMVGETGWQLSHGERSRLYLVRALLQKSKLIVLDESFASLDPETLDQCLRCALKRASTLLVIKLFIHSGKYLHHHSAYPHINKILFLVTYLIEGIHFLVKNRLS